MNKISYFKLQAKNFLRDFKTQKKDQEGIYFYSPKFFKDINDIIVSFDIDEDNFTLMNAQYIIANLAGFDKWSDLLEASPEALELGELLFNNRNNSGDVDLTEDWNMYLAMNGFQDFDDASKLEIFNIVFLEQPID